MTDEDLEQRLRGLEALGADVEELKSLLGDPHNAGGLVGEVKGLKALLGGPDSDEGLAAEVRTLAQGLHHIASEVAGDLDGSTTDSDGDDAAADEPADGDGKDEGKRQVSVAWVDVPPARAADFIEELAAWVRTVAPYQVARLQLPDCWVRHPDVVQVLIDVRAIWRALYRPGGQAGVWLLADFHLRHWPELIKLVNSLMQKCKDKASHQEPTSPREVEMPLSETLRTQAVAWAGRET